MADRPIKQDIQEGFMSERGRRGAPDRPTHQVGRDASEDAPVTDDGGAMSVEERMQALRNEFIQEQLPKAPPIPGFHTCWLSTNNQYDPIARRLRLGYVPVKAEEVPGFESLKMQSGQFDGCVCVNEMVLFKLEMAQYQAIMRLLHHELPQEEEEKLRYKTGEELESLLGEDSSGRRLAEIEGDGLQELGRVRRRAPIFQG